MRRIPWLCRALIGVAGVMVPRSRRAEWKREWSAELACMVAEQQRVSSPGPSLRVMLRHTLPCFADALQIRKLARGERSAAAQRAGWARPEPIRAARHTARALLRNPMFSTAAVLTLGLGIGANTAIFSLVNAVALKPPAVEDSDRLVRIYTSTPEGRPYGSTSYLELQDIAEQAEAFDGVVGYALALGAMVEDGKVQALLGEVVTGNYFGVLGVDMALGRSFREDEDVTPGTHPVVVLGHGFWTRRFGADPEIIGTTIKLNSVSFDVIGVAARDYLGLIPGLAAEFWVPSMMIGRLVPDAPAALTSRTSRQFLVHARLRDGATVSEAQAEVSLVAGRLEEEFPDTNDGHTMAVLSADSVRFHPRLDAVILPIAMLMLVVPGMVLLIACTNLAGLMLARATDRRKEIAVRLALGAGRRQVVGQLLAESLMLSVVGGVLGVILASWLLKLIVGFKPPLLVSLSLDVGIDYRVLVFTLTTSVFAGLLFGLVPAMKSSKPDLSRALKDEAGMAWRSRRVTLRDALVVGQVAISTLLLLVAGLFVRSLQSAETLEAGWDTESSVVFTMDAAMRYDEAGGREYYRQALDQMARLPGATSVAIADQLPLGFASQTMPISREGTALSGGPARGEDAETIPFGRITPGFFRTLGIGLVAGRDFDDGDRESSSPVVIVSEAAAEYLWGEEDPLGKQLRSPGGGVREVVGVARDTRGLLSASSSPYVYVPFAQRYESAVELIIATDRDPSAFLATAQEALLRVDPEVIPLELSTMADLSNVFLFPVRAAAWGMGAFGLLGLLLSAVGIVGTLAYAVAQRGHEVGVRLALGARPEQLVRMVVAGGMRRVAIGMMIGLACAFGVAQLLQAVLVGVSPTDPVAFGIVTLLLASVACVASYIPARRAAQADPLVVLRHE